MKNLKIWSVAEPETSLLILQGSGSFQRQLSDFVYVRAPF